MPPIAPPDPPLTDGVVTLRQWRHEDAEPLAAIMDEAEIARWATGVPAPYRLRDALGWLATHPVLMGRGESLPLAIADARSDELLGSIGLRIRENDRGEVGYIVAAHARRRGVGSRALRLIARYGFDALALTRIELVIQPGNVASLALAERVGFQREGLLRAYLPGRNGEKLDAVMLSLLPGELR